MNRREIGLWGEKLAAAFLQGKGYEILASNIYTPYGEIDILAIKEGLLVFVEVKTRTTESYGKPESSLTAQKRNHMVNAAEHYLSMQKIPNEVWQIDVITVEALSGSEAPEITHFENAVNE